MDLATIIGLVGGVLTIGIVMILDGGRLQSFLRCPGYFVDRCRFLMATTITVPLPVILKLLLC